MAVITEIIIPAAGKSTRFPNMKPKYLLYDYTGKPMIYNVILPYFLEGKTITVGILKEHQEKYDAIQHILNPFQTLNNGNVRVLILDKPTGGPAETVYNMIKDKQYFTQNKDFPFLIRDCDSFFKHDDTDGNYVCCSNIKDHDVLKKLGSKSFIQYNDQGFITNIIEKEVISDTFSVGGYKFNSAGEFKSTFEKFKNAQKEIYISHIVRDMVENGYIFTKKEVTDYIDVGTAEDWHEHNNKPTLFCDIDGTIIKAQSRFGNYSYGCDPVILEENLKRVKEYYEKGCQVIFVTSRESIYRQQTLDMLEKLGFIDVILIDGLNNSSRILINDYTSHAPYPRAMAVNIKRDSDNLGDFI